MGSPRQKDSIPCEQVSGPRDEIEGPDESVVGRVSEVLPATLPGPRRPVGVCAHLGHVQGTQPHTAPSGPPSPHPSFKWFSCHLESERFRYTWSVLTAKVTGPSLGSPPSPATPIQP